MTLCPGCGASVPRERDAFRPFCSERCRLVDLGAWLGGAYRIPGADGDAPGDDVSADEEAVG